MGKMREISSPKKWDLRREQRKKNKSTQELSLATFVKLKINYTTFHVKEKERQTYYVLPRKMRNYRKERAANNLNGNKFCGDGDRRKSNLKKERGHKNDLLKRRM